MQTSFRYRSLGLSVLTALLFCAVGLFTGCKNNSSQSNGTQATDSLKTQQDQQALKEEEDVVVTVPSPLELASLLKKAGANYNEKVLNSPANEPKYNTAFSQGLNLGVYGADLGYVTYYNQSQVAGRYLTAVQKLSSSLNILGAFQREVMERISKNIDKQDSLLFIISSQFEHADENLKNVDRKDVAATLVAGGWIEGLYLATQMEKTKHNELIKNRIGELKLSLTSLLQVTNRFKEKPEFVQLFAQLNSLYDTYQKVKIDYVTKPQLTTKDAAKDVVSVDTGTTSIVTISDETVKEITDKIEAIRKGIVS